MTSPEVSGETERQSELFEIWNQLIGGSPLKILNFNFSRSPNF
jgi:hypothetical protein